MGTNNLNAIFNFRAKDASTMVFAAIFVALFSVGVGSYLTVMSSSSVGTARIAEQQKAFYAAEAGAYRMLYELNIPGSTATSVSDTLSTSTYTASYGATYGSGMITSTGTVGAMFRTLTVRTLDIPPNVRGAVTVNSSATTSGSITIDGRDHDENGNLTGGGGTNGISAAGIVSQGGSSLIGGNGIEPASPASPDSYEQSVFPFPGTAPWDILGVSQTWFEANVPAQPAAPPSGYNGIYYYNPPGGEWNPVNFGDSGAGGILIVHNSTNTATMKNLHGTFKGLIITDQITHISGDAEIYGAVITTNQVGNTLGNGNATVAYSSKILSDLAPLVGGQTTNWKKVIQPGSWKEQ